MFVLINSMLQFLVTHRFRRNIEARIILIVVFVEYLYHLEWFIGCSLLGIQRQFHGDLARVLVTTDEGDRSSSR